jgi:hypothetical protein
MATDRVSKKSAPSKESASATPQRTRKKAKTLAQEELSPERRVELAQQIEAKLWRGRPPSI